MSLTLKVNGTEYENFTDVSVSTSLTHAASSFSFTCSSASGANSFPFGEGDTVEVLMDSEHLILTGRIDEYSVSYSSNSHVVNVKGRSKTAILVDSTLSGAIQTTEKTTLYSLCKKICDNFGLSVVNEVGAKASDEIALTSAKQGVKAFDYLLAYARANGLLLTDNEYGDLVITQASTNKSKHCIKNVEKGLNNNILSANFKVNLANVYSEYEIIGEGNPSELNKNNFKKMISANGIATEDDMDVELEKRLTKISTAVMGATEDLAKQAVWEMGVRRFKAFTYSCVIQGHSYGGGPAWEKNVIYSVEDTFAVVEKYLLCDSATYSFSSAGSTTQLNLSLPNALTEEPKKDKLTSKVDKTALQAGSVLAVSKVIGQ